MRVRSLLVAAAIAAALLFMPTTEQANAAGSPAFCPYLAERVQQDLPYRPWDLQR